MRPVIIVGNLFGVVGLFGILGCSAVTLWLASQRPTPKDGLSATYFRRLGFKGHPFKRTDGRLDFYWKKKPPMLGIRADRFSVSWKGCIDVPSSDLHLAVEADGAVAAWIDGKQQLGEVGPAQVRVVVAESSLTPGPHEVLIHYQHKDGDARFRAAFASSGGSLRTISPHSMRPGACK